MRRGSMRWPRRKRLFSGDVCAAPARSRSSAACFCSALGPAADDRDGAPWRDALNPPRSRESASAFCEGFSLVFSLFFPFYFFAAIPIP
jgi:hypothetical protein